MKTHLFQPADASHDKRLKHKETFLGDLNMSALSLLAGVEKTSLQVLDVYPSTRATKKVDVCG